MDLDHPLEPRSYLATTPAAIVNAMGSKYTVTYPNHLLREVLRRGGRYAFVGVACQVEGLRKAQTVIPALDRAFVLVLGLFCGTTNTPRATVVGIRRAGLDPSDVSAVAYRGDGWPGAFRLKTRSGEMREIAYPDYCDRWFSAQMPSRCLLCPDGTNELADISLGDAWLERFEPPRTTGASFLILRNPRVASMLADLEAKWICLEPADDADIVAAQEETHEIKRAGVRGSLWVRKLRGGTLPRFRGLDLVASRSERRAALVSGVSRCLYRWAGRLRYRFEPKGTAVISPVATVPAPREE
jgi:coenzyme F420 hydrogenase subunit beta